MNDLPLCEICDSDLILENPSESYKIYFCPLYKNTHFYICYRDNILDRKVYLFDFKINDIIWLVNLTCYKNKYALIFPDTNSINGKKNKIINYSLNKWNKYMNADFDPKNPQKILDKLKIRLLFD